VTGSAADLSNSMTRPLSPLELAVLTCVSFDYAALATLRKNVAADLHRDVLEVELQVALKALRERCFVGSFIRDPDTGNLVPCSLDDLTAAAETWWLATTAGNRIVESAPQGP
jgi:hypothetical protein